MAAKRLASFSIETDQEVLVTFDDGQSERLQRGELKKRLQAEDYSQIDQAFKVRQSFWRKNLPKGLMVLVAGTAAALTMMITADRPLLHIVTPQKIVSHHADNDLQAAHVIATPAPKSATSAPTSLPSASPRNEPAEAEHDKGLVRRLTDTVTQMLK